jgi:hypothetical protein
LSGLPSTIAFFGAYNHLKNKLDSMLPESKRGGFRETINATIAGAAADFVSLCLWVPCDIISQRLQIQTNKNPSSMKYNNGFQLIRAIAKTEGFRGFYRGFGAAIVATAPASAVWWATYEQCKRMFGGKKTTTTTTSSDKPAEDSLWVQSASGAIAGTVAAITSMLGFFSYFRSFLPLSLFLISPSFSFLLFPLSQAILLTLSRLVFKRNIIILLLT